jgi:sulfate adenylyltransferase
MSVLNPLPNWLDTELNVDTMKASKAARLHNPPHGGVLVDRVARGDFREALIAEAKTLPQVHLTRREVTDLEMIANGGFSPLTGFMTQPEYDFVVSDMHLPNGLPWTVPVVLSAQPDEAEKAIRLGRAALVDHHGHTLGVLEVEDLWRPSKEDEARHVLRTTDVAHPGVAYLQQEAGSYYLGGPIWLLDFPHRLPTFEPYWLSPADVRALFQARGWRRVVGFQTRNPIHRAHEYITKNALELVDGLLIHPIGEVTKSDDVPADVRVKCYEVLIEKYYPKDRVALAINPSAMRYAGPREAVFHAIVRKNYGCTHFIVGRDHAGVGNYYGTYDAQLIFDEFDPQLLGIQPMFFEHAFFCTTSQAMASEKTAPPGGQRIQLSGTKVREMLQRGEIPPPEFTRPEVARILIEAYQDN